MGRCHWTHNRSGLSRLDQLMLMRSHHHHGLYYIYSSLYPLTVLAKEAVREAKLASPLVWIPPTVPGKHLVVPGGLWGLCSVINELQ